jgi:hypothetical protein
LDDRRTNFTPENLEMYLICNCEKREWLFLIKFFIKFFAIE